MMMKRVEKKKFDLKELKTFIIKWNQFFPLDLWWRRKYKVAFNSPQHRAISPIDIAFEYWEEKMLKKSVKLREVEKKDLADYKETHKMLKDKAFAKLSKKEIIEIYDNINLEDFN